MPAEGRTCQRRDEEGYQYRQGTPDPEALVLYSGQIVYRLVLYPLSLIHI